MQIKAIPVYDCKIDKCAHTKKSFVYFYPIENKKIGGKMQLYN
jgi:hypothetical protein